MLRTLTLVAIILALAPPAHSQESVIRSAPPDSTALEAVRGIDSSESDAIEIEDAGEFTVADGDSLAMVRLRGRELFEVRGVSVLSASDRADDVAQTIKSIASDIRRRPEDIRVVRDDRIGATVVMGASRFIIAAWDYEAEALGQTANDLAEERAEIIREAIVRYRRDSNSASVIRGALYAGAALIVLIVVLVLLGRIRDRVDRVLHRRLQNRTLFKVLSGESLISLGTALDRMLWFVFVIWAWLAFLNFVLSLFPWTYGFASRVWEMAIYPARVFGSQTLEQVPSLFFLAFIAAVAVMVTRGLRFVFDEIGARRIYIRGFYPDWARPTFNIMRLVVIGFAVVVAIPYIPGSGSSAFKGMSLFIGVLVSLGSGSAMANVVSGVIMIYMRPFNVGDRVQIGDTVGDVVDRNLLTTRIRTTKNERVTIPNTNILSGQIINFTSKRRTKELILHTSVTLGYDMDWRQIHELLIGAARDTKNVLEDPEPFVLQKALHDFYVEYELNAYTGEPREIPSTYSELHQNIQDKFKEAGLEILSPHFRSHRDGDSLAKAVGSVPVTDD
ncbi:mechanosensitive ion channel family protein [bacterium]|nr:MAG: mechanosensitive ion channel family protein [bacterium]